MLQRLFDFKRHYVMVVALVFATLMLGAVPYRYPEERGEVQPLSQEVVNLLNNYSLYLSTGTTNQKSYYAMQVVDLVQERQAYYREFFNTALHLELTDISSTFRVDSSAYQIALSENVLSIHIIEEITLYGKSLISSSDEYPLIIAANWAIAHTSDPAVQQALNFYAESMKESVNESIREGVTITFAVRHEFRLISEKNTLQMITDTFTDKSNDNVNGNDNVIWVDNQHIRLKPDFTVFPDYIIYNTLLEDLGKSLLDDYDVYHGKQNAVSDTYNRTNAKNYINYYTSNTGLTCATGVYSDPTKYATFYNYFVCNDCTNYVSQAIHAGGFSYDGSWYPYSWSWNTTYGLRDYLLTVKQVGVWYSNATSLKIGDIAFAGGKTAPYHVVMVGGVNPHRYSGHSSDRKLYSWNSSLNAYMHILDVVGK